MQTDLKYLQCLDQPLNHRLTCKNIYNRTNCTHLKAISLLKTTVWLEPNQTRKWSKVGESLVEYRWSSSTILLVDSKWEKTKLQPTSRMTDEFGCQDFTLRASLIFRILSWQIESIQTPLSHKWRYMGGQRLSLSNCTMYENKWDLLLGHSFLN